jgi:S1-C subfamily serine protease
MANRDGLSKNRVAGIAVLVVAVVTVIAAVAVGSGWWDRQHAASATEPMELRGHWLGMRLSGADSTSARQLGIPPSVKGVVIAEVAPGMDSRALQAGLMSGDVVIRIDGREVTNLSELYTLSTKLDIARPLALDILRRGQPLSLLIPGPVELPFQQVGGGYPYPAGMLGRSQRPARQ